MQYNEITHFKVKIGPREVIGRRRRMDLMLQVGDPAEIFGMLSSVKKDKDASGEDIAKAAAAFFETAKKTLSVALVAVDGHDPTDEYMESEEAAALSEPFFYAFLKSGLDAVPFETP